HRVRQMGRAGHRPDDVSIDAPRGVLRRRCRLWTEEHHLGGRARPPGRDLHSSSLPGRGGERASGPRHEPAEPQDGHARVELRERLLAGRAAADARAAQAQDCLESTMSAANSTRVNDFTIKIATVNGTGSASANTLLMKSIFRSGIPVMGKNYFPSNIQGLPTWYEIRITRDGH